MQDVVINWNNLTTTGKPCEGAIKEFTWKDFEKVLMQLDGGKGMSQSDFVKIYGQQAVEITPADKGGNMNVQMNIADNDASLPFMTWTLTPAELGKLTVGTNTLKVKKTVKFVDKDNLHPTIVVNLEMTVNTNVGAASLGKTNPLKWDNNGTMKVFPVPMTINSDGTVPAGQQATYKTNILEGREKPYVTGLLSCAKYNIDYKGGKAPAGCSALELPSGMTSWSFDLSNQANVNAIYFKLIKGNSAAEKLASNGGDVTIDWSSNINGIDANAYVFGSMTLHVVKILNLTTTTPEKFVDNSHSQTINIANNFSMTDAYGNLVAEKSTTAANGKYAADYYKFYGVQKPVFGNAAQIPSNAAVKKIVICNNPNGTGTQWTPAELNMTANFNSATGEFTFQNNGAPLQSNAYILVPVSVKHYWGTLTGHIAIPLEKSNAPLSKRRR